MARKSLSLSFSLPLSLFLYILTLEPLYRLMHGWTTTTCWPMRSFGRARCHKRSTHTYIYIYILVFRFLGTSCIYIELQRKTYVWGPGYIYIYIYLALGVYILVSWSLALGPWLLGPWLLVPASYNPWLLVFGSQSLVWGIYIYIYINNAIQRYHNVSYMNLAWDFLTAVQEKIQCLPRLMSWRYTNSKSFCLAGQRTPRCLHPWPDPEVLRTWWADACRAAQ